jgi:peptidoglycan/LPS O-acetylase OafA/YrhL
MNEAPPVVRPVRRNQRFDILRLLFASLVILAHAPELTDGNRSRELFNRLTHSGESFGSFAVDGFFLLSGFLIVQSWTDDPELLNFLRKRLLRIVPGYVVAAVLSVAAVGLLAPGTDHFFHKLGMPFLRSLLVFTIPETPPVLPGMPDAVVNGSLWTLAYEVRCYLLVGVLGFFGLFRRPWLWLAATVLLLLGAANPAITTQWHWPPMTTALVGNVYPDFHLTAAFFVGGCFYLFRDRIRFKPGMAAVAGAILLACRFVSPTHIEMALVGFGSYLMFYLVQLKTESLRPVKGLPDISYGIYLYGFPVESLWIFFFHGSPWITAAVSMVLSAVLGWISWHAVERPCLKLKRRSTAALPARDLNLEAAGEVTK